MFDSVVKNQTVSGRNFDSLSLSVKYHFSVMKKTFNPKNYEAKVQFESKYMQYHDFAVCSVTLGMNWKSMYDCLMFLKDCDPHSK